MTSSQLSQTFRNALKKRLSARGMKKKIAQELGIDQASISRLLNAKGEVELSTVEKYANILEIHPAELLGGNSREVTVEECIQKLKEHFGITIDGNKDEFTLTISHKDREKLIEEFYSQWAPHKEEIERLLSNHTPTSPPPASQKVGKHQN